MRVRTRLSALLASAAIPAVLAVSAVVLATPASAALRVKYTSCVNKSPDRKVCIRQVYKNSKWVKTHRCTFSRSTGKRLYCRALTTSASASGCTIEGGLMADSSTPRGAAADIVSFTRKPYVVNGVEMFENGMPVWVLSATLMKPGYALCRVVVTHFPNGEKEAITLVPVGGRASMRLPTNDIPSIGASVRRVNVS